ncbi:unnamed protein product, partial [Allacma fusca]
QIVKWIVRSAKAGFKNG